MKNFLILSLLLAFLTTEVCAQWKPAGDKIKTQWANKINTSAVLPEYISRKTKCSTFAKHFVPKSHLLTQFKM